MPTREERKKALMDQTRQSHRERGQRSKGSLAEQVLRSLPLDVEWAEMRTGRDLNEFDIIPFYITQEWFKDMKMKSGRRPEGKSDVGYLSYKFEIPCHRGVGPNNEWWLCNFEAFGKPCVMCEEKFAEFDKPKAEQDEKVWRPLMPSWRDFYNIYDYNNPDKDIHPFEISYAHFEDALLQAIELDDDELLCPWDPDDGKIIEFKAKEEKFKSYSYAKPLEGSFAFAERDQPYTDEDLERAWSFDKYLYIPKYDELAKAYYGVEDLGEVGRGTEQEEEQEEERKPTRSRSRQKPADREEEGESPRSRRSRRTREPEPQEEEEQEAPTPARSRSRSKGSTKKKDEGQECPAGGEFGKDCNELDECQDCPDEIFDKCVELQDKLKTKEEEKENPPEEEEEKPKKRPRRRTK